MSQNTGVQPMRVMAWVVEAKVKGVVMISPPRREKASSMFSSARWPLVKSVTCGTPRYSRSALSSA